MRRRERDRVRRAEMYTDFQARMASEIRRLFPGCAARRAAEIAGHAGERGSERVGRSAAGHALDKHAILLAVVASVRHPPGGSPNPHHFRTCQDHRTRSIPQTNPGPAPPDRTPPQAPWVKGRPSATAVPRHGHPPSKVITQRHIYQHPLQRPLSGQTRSWRVRCAGGVYRARVCRHVGMGLVGRRYGAAVLPGRGSRASESGGEAEWQANRQRPICG